MTSSPPITRATAVWTFAGLVLLTVNLRAAITSIAPMLADVRTAFGLSGFEVSVLTTLPVLCLGIFAAIAPLLARRIGAEQAIALALVLVTAGIVLRVIPARSALFVGTVMAGAGIAMGNVLFPAVIKRVFPAKVGALTGMAMMLMATSGAIAAGLAVPLNEAGGWRLALAVWAVPSLVAVLIWGPLALRGARRTAKPAQAPPPSTPAQGSLLRAPLAWFVTAFMGLTSLMFYVLLSWLPEIMRDHGYSAATAGSMVSVMMIIGIPLGFVIPVLAARMRDQRPLIGVIAITMVAGLLGLLLAPTQGWLWVTIIGLATGSAFPFAITLLNLRSPNATVAASLSGMAQCGGYLLAGLGPLAVGVLHSATGSWDVSLILLLVLVIPQLGFGLLVARPGFVRPVTRHGEPLVEPKDMVAPVPENAVSR
ncbi:CynX/NimT family MFS transporter [Actinomadura sp. 9N407]|uniref:CynX/NimT family MFS transporter n=1 Tax=Actinomadura sp. 9N407 TaxID=3375154 RepID=UPI00379A3828